jgi:hypothetical protein
MPRVSMMVGAARRIAAAIRAWKRRLAPRSWLLVPQTMPAMTKRRIEAALAVGPVRLLTISGEKLQGGLDRLGLNPEGLALEPREGDPVIFAVRVVEGRELVGVETRERTVVVDDQVCRVPEGDVAAADGEGAGLETVEGVVVEVEDGEGKEGALDLDGADDIAVLVIALGDRDELALEDALGEKRWMAGIVGLELFSVEHPRGEGEGDVNRLGWHRGLVADA